MGKALTKSQLIGALADKNELTKKAVEEILEELTGLAYKGAKNGFTFPGIGKLAMQNRKARMGRNPQTGEAIKIPAKKVLKFRVAKAAKDAILGKR
ncbi:MAG TPA: DNA-binding protein [Nitrospiraceae bacterium]|nr:DNA-binding protein [Nitrospiraceae bacterium]